MAVANFVELCGGYCEIENQQAPQLIPDERQFVAFTVYKGDVPVTVAHSRDVRPGHVFVVGNIGKPDDEMLYALSLLMLSANFFDLDKDSGVIGRNAKTGEFVLQQALLLEDTDAFELRDRVEALVGAVRLWRLAVVKMASEAEASQKEHNLADEGGRN